MPEQLKKQGKPRMAANGKRFANSVKTLLTEETVVSKLQAESSKDRCFRLQ